MYRLGERSLWAVFSSFFRFAPAAYIYVYLYIYVYIFIYIIILYDISCITHTLHVMFNIYLRPRDTTEHLSRFLVTGRTPPYIRVCYTCVYVAAA